ncbi:MAG: hypothetical protein JWO08_4530 [Verrucomicrobiaceae bacterium]|nr:hypothetical protein [Verrucomicrobiaceae bacterium]
MKTFHHIIAAVDFTPCCRAALHEAVRRASLDGAEVTVVHVMEESLIRELKAALSTNEISVREEWEGKLRAFVNEAEPAAVGVKVEVRVGHPFEELVQACATHEADLLVMGPKGSINEPGHIGVIAAKCVRKAPVDVLIVRKSASGPFKRIVACVDFSENAAKAVQFALHVAGQDGAELDCLHVFQSATTVALDYGGFATPLPPMVSDEEAAKEWRSELEEFLEPLTRKAQDLQVRSLIKDSPSIREAIMEHVSETHADLVVLGTRGKSGLREMLIGTTAEKILQGAPCSILAVKPDDFIANTCD